MVKTAPSPSVRNSSIELLRILSMLLIVTSHICHHSGFDLYAPMSVNRLFVQFGVLGNLGVVLFVFISGYFQCEREFRLTSLSRLLAQVWFYSIGLYLLCRFGFGYPYDSGQLWAVFFPTVFNEYWFFTAYVILLLLTPFLNTLIRALTQRQFKAMLLIMITLWSVLPTLTGQYLYASEIPQFILFYLIGAWFRRFPQSSLRSRKAGIWLTILSLLLLFSLTILLGYWERYSPEAFGASARLYDRNSLIILVCAVGLFVTALYTKPFTNRFVNTLSGCTFGVYLIHDNPAIRELLWKNWLNQIDYFYSPSFIPRLILCILLVFCICTAVEFLRQKTTAKPMEALTHRLLSALVKTASRFL